MKRAILVYMVFCLIAPITVEAKKKPFGNGFYWELSDDGTLTISGKGDMPDFTEGKTPWYKKLIKEKITKVIIEEGITHIGANSFGSYLRYDNNLKSIEFPNSVKYIGNWAFHNCDKLEFIVIPNSVKTIGDGAFNGCKKLSTTIPYSVEYIGKSAFYHCYNLYTEIPNSVKHIGSYAFSGCKFIFFKIPNSIKSIEEGTFTDCNELTTVDIPNSVVSINAYAFYLCI